MTAEEYYKKTTGFNYKPEINWTLEDCMQFAESYHKAKVEAITDEEIEFIASEESQQDWNDLKYKKVHKEAFQEGVKWLKQKLLNG